MRTYELKPKYDGRKSFYGKATVIESLSGKKILRSYSTDVCYIDSDGLHRTWGGYSATTMRHINEFVFQMLGETLNKKTWESMKVETPCFIFS